VFVPQLDSIWALVPNFDSERLLTAMKHNGLTLVQLSVLLHYLCEEDEPGCEKELENIINSAPKVVAPLRRAEDVPQAQLEEIYRGPAWVIAVEATHGTVPPFTAWVNRGWGAHSCSSHLHEEVSMQASKMPKWIQGDVEEDRKSRDSEELTPFLEMGPIKIWSKLHLAFILCSVVGLTFTVVASFNFRESREFTNVFVAVLGFVLSLGLTVAARLIKVLRTIRKECAELAKENDQLEHSLKDLSKEISKLMKLKKGFQALNSECTDNLTLATNLIHKSNTNTKMQVKSIVMRLFKDAGKNKNKTIDPEEVELFIHDLKLVFGSVMTFSEEMIRTVATGFTAKEMKALVDIIMDDH